MALVNEKIVLDFYLEEIEKDNIFFLKGKDSYKNNIKENIISLKEKMDMHNKIEEAKKLWKSLFEAAMSYIDSDKRGYDDLFSYFDEYVNFEELIFASDSFYRDHTLHCLWVYFLGEYIKRNDEYKNLVDNSELQGIESINSLITALNQSKHSDIFKPTVKILKNTIKLLENCDSIRCVCALIHDLGYPIKKINKINKGVKKILPYFSINNYNEFDFNFSQIQQNFINDFIEFISNEGNTNYISPENEEDSELLNTIFNDFKPPITINDKELDKLSEKQIKRLKKIINTPKINVEKDVTAHIRYSNDFEKYEHGIMSAFLLMKTIYSFSSMKCKYNDNLNIAASHFDSFKIYAYQDILRAISDHTSPKYQINDISDYSEFLIFIDELEEFSRISRANQNRQFITEFCKTDISVKNQWFQVDFIFDNNQITDLDPEFAFKNRCKRFLNLFNISEIENNVKIRMRCIGKLEYDQNIYCLEIAQKYANITINGEEQNIPKYLKSKVFYSKEEYMNL